MSAADLYAELVPIINAGLATCCVLAFVLGAVLVRVIARG